MVRPAGLTAAEGGNDQRMRITLTDILLLAIAVMLLIAMVSDEVSF